MRWLGLALLVGCYRPVAPAGAPCSASGDCPADQACIANVCGGVALDAALAEDAPALDALDAPPDAVPTVPPELVGITVDKGPGGSRTIAFPPGISNGDLLLAHVSVDNHNAIEIGTPAGWTRLTEIDNGELFSALVFYAFVGPQGPSTTWTFPSGTTNYNAVAISAFSGVKRIRPVDAFGSTATASTATPDAPSISTTVPHTRLVAMFTMDNITDPFAPPLGMTELYEDIVTGTGLPFEAAHAPFATPDATGPRSASVATAGPSIGILVALTPE